MGLPTAEMSNLVMGTLDKQFREKDMRTFEEFHMAILDILNTLNAALPGKRYDVPSPNEVQVCFDEWKEANASEKEKVFIEFMKKKVNLSKLNNSTLITCIITPLIAMATKRACETILQLEFIKAIPDVVFVPTATMLVLVSVKSIKAIPDIVHVSMLGLLPLVKRTTLNILIKSIPNFEYVLMLILPFVWRTILNLVRRFLT